MKIMTRLSTGMALLAGLSLAGCGGGGGDSTGIGPSAEGVYGGALTGSSSSHFQMLVLEDGEFWAMYGTQLASQFLVAGFIQGTGVSSDGSFTASNVRDYGVSPALSGTASATYDASAKTIAGKVTAGGASVSFSGGPIAGSLYVYDSPAKLSTVSGSWTLSTLAGDSLSMNVSGDGAISAATADGCNFTGTMVPRPSGKNVFNVSLTFGPPPCALAGQGASGIAVAYPLSSGKTQLIVAGTNAGRTVGTAAFGVR